MILLQIKGKEVNERLNKCLIAQKKEKVSRKKWY